MVSTGDAVTVADVPSMRSAPVADLEAVECDAISSAIGRELRISKRPPLPARHAPPRHSGAAEAN